MSSADESIRRNMKHYATISKWQEAGTLWKTLGKMRIRKAFCFSITADDILRDVVMAWLGLALSIPNI